MQALILESGEYWQILEDGSLAVFGPDESVHTLFSREAYYLDDSKIYLTLDGDRWVEFILRKDWKNEVIHDILHVFDSDDNIVALYRSNEYRIALNKLFILSDADESLLDCLELAQDDFRLLLEGLNDDEYDDLSGREGNQ